MDFDDVNAFRKKVEIEPKKQNQKGLHGVLQS